MNFYKEYVKTGKKNLTPGKKVEMCFNFSFLW